MPLLKLEHREDVLLGLGAEALIFDLAVLEDDEGRHAGDLVLEGQVRTLVDVHLVDGHLTRESLETMTKANLEKLAKDMGVEIPRGATKALIIEQLAAVTVEAPAPDGGAQ